jgi:hypothetical protein
MSEFFIICVRELMDILNLCDYKFVCVRFVN